MHFWTVMLSSIALAGAFAVTLWLKPWINEYDEIDD